MTECSDGFKSIVRKKILKARKSRGRGKRKTTENDAKYQHWPG